MKISKKNGVVVLLLLVLAGLSRMLPHPPNVAPIAAMSIFGAAYFKPKWLALVLPLVVLWLSNVLLDNTLLASYYDGFTWFSNPSVYIGFLLIGLVSLFTLRKKVNPSRVFGTSIGGSLIFFLVTNFYSWYGFNFYPKSVAGLMASYTAGLPFLWNTLLGDLFFCVTMFAAYEWYRSLEGSKVVATR